MTITEQGNTDEIYLLLELALVFNISFGLFSSICSKGTFNRFAFLGEVEIWWK